ncbi:MAG: hypothetical protein V7L21_21855 [Nostoc sp.]|uniref:hypothetical protein n=1 Tax=unclassified Nostoc TaxID=2593658 RepID=UPI0025DE7442|nr:hypothetical protein [Nostoc sp. NMS9]MBN3941303.1 hypothetical protein [Nostoc sp. NMS9]MBN3941305.1 hypothetical protein [Nostoc sp. NMS9]
MATIKISELQPESQFEKLSDADLRLVNGGGSNSQFQVTTGGTSLATGVNAGGGRIQNDTQSFGTVQGGVGSPSFLITFNANAFSQSSPS